MITIHTQVHNVNQERLRLNQTKAENAELRKEVDSLRKELINATQECKKLQTNTKKAKK